MWVEGGRMKWLHVSTKYDISKISRSDDESPRCEDQKNRNVELQRSQENKKVIGEIARESPWKLKAGSSKKWEKTIVSWNVKAAGLQDPRIFIIRDVQTSKRGSAEHTEFD